VIRFTLLLCTAVLACGITSASATMRIVEGRHLISSLERELVHDAMYSAHAIL
jgi:hypothetical protein